MGDTMNTTIILPSDQHNVDYEDLYSSMSENAFSMGKSLSGYPAVAYLGRDDASMVLYSATMKDTADLYGKQAEWYMDVDPESYDDPKAATQNMYKRFFEGLEKQDTGARLGLGSLPYASHELGSEGLGMMNRTAVEPMMDSMLELDQKYHFMDDDFKAYLGKVELTGCGNLAEYQPGAFVEKQAEMEQNVDALRSGYVEDVVDAGNDPLVYNKRNIYEFVEEQSYSLYDCSGCETHIGRPAIENYDYFDWRTSTSLQGVFQDDVAAQIAEDIEQNASYEPEILPITSEESVTPSVNESIFMSEPKPDVSDTHAYVSTGEDKLSSGAVLPAADSFGERQTVESASPGQRYAEAKSRLPDFEGHTSGHAGSAYDMGLGG